jgi:fatty acid CoA ligase FadD9
MLLLLDAVDRPQAPVGGPTLPCPRFVEATAEAGATADGKVPHLGPQLIARYIADLKAAGLLD